MDYTIFGDTGVRVGIAGLGCGGSSRLGQRHGASVDDSVRLIREAFELGVNYVDTSEAYETSHIVAKALKGCRDDVVVSTKAKPLDNDGSPIYAGALRDSVEKALVELETSYIDVLHLHAVTLKLYEHCLEELVPELKRLQREGVIRWTAISEQFATDTTHEMFQRASMDDCWDVKMVGFNILNQTAKTNVFPQALASGAAIEIMYAVRSLLSNPDMLRSTVAQLVEDGFVSSDVVDLTDPLGFLVHEGGASSVVDAAYRFARHESGAQVVLTGTGSVEHLKSNVESICRGPLPSDDRDRLVQLFGHLTKVTGN